MNVHKKRIRPLNDLARDLWLVTDSQDSYSYTIKDSIHGSVAYWMSRGQRVNDNWALLFAQDLSVTFNIPLHCMFYTGDSSPVANHRQYDFMFSGLEEVEASFSAHQIPFTYLVGNTVTSIEDYCKRYSVGVIVADFSPLKIDRKMKEEIARKIKVPLFEVDTHNIVPVWEASSKCEFAAYTIRPKINKKLAEYLTDFPVLKKQNSKHFDTFKKIHKINWNKIKKSISMRDDIKSVDWIIPGEKKAQKVLHDFIQTKLEFYSEKRNDPLADVSSNLSPYLHFGQISSQRVALEIKKASSKKIHLRKGAEDFLEELIIRKELSDNFCLYNQAYDSTECFPMWAKNTLKAHKGDKRDHVYTLKEFETGKTHDELWNAAQCELVATGKMHGYMRMYWAKKIFEWSSSADVAMDIAIYLNDTYELDGRDPNGYVGIAWCIGGVHDRAWFQRPVFGQVRFMARSGCDKKFDTKKYIQKFTLGV